ncbi:sensor histidine kinase [Streptomyces sp. NPDC057621]|uniref:sensor histidine kinase n=1 Tax=Streptomyces sp. NPDC057621 TaxID=3346186 RepID=UPI003688C7A8
MTENVWQRWPSREALSGAGVHRARHALTLASRVLAVGILLVATFKDSDLHGWGVAAAVLGVLACGFGVWGFTRTTLDHRLLPSLGLLALLFAVAVVAHGVGLRVPALVLWCVCGVIAMERLPLLAALPATCAALGAYAAVNHDGPLSTVATTGGIALAGYVLRLDAEARGSTQRLLTQERAARAAEAESAALAERARIAREIHDVLAHSLSAQLVHLEAARLLIEGGGEKDQVLDRVVAARRMAREGLAETRQALSALRGELSPLEEFLSELVAESDGADVTVTGERRLLPAEASQAVRRVAQEALTNVRKHAPGAKVRIRMEYGPHEVTLHVRDSGAPPGEFTHTGAGYGLLGMRERAELLGGSLEAGPYEEGFVVTLKVPV